MQAAAKSTWESVKTLAASRHEYLLASRALGEQGIAAYVLGDIGTAKKQVGSAWTVAKYAGDQAAQIRYASAYGMGLVDVKRYRESLGPLNEALNVYRQHTDLGYPAEAIATKIEALSGLGNYSQALSLLGDALRYATTHHWLGELYQLYSIRAGIHERQGVWNLARADYEAALSHARTIGYWRGLAEAGGLLARVFEHENQLSQALHTVDEAIQANKQIPDELYLVPRNLAIKADILAKMGRLKASNDLYQKSADLIDSLLQTAPSVNVERTLVSQLSNVYSGYFVSLCNQDQYQEAFRVIERARGRLETQALQHYDRIPSHKPTSQEQRLTRLNLQLLDTDDPKEREQLTRDIYEAELQINTPSLAGQAVTSPVELGQLQAKLRPSELLLEYVLSEPQSYVLTITHQSVARYALHGKNQLEDLANQYRSTIRKRQTDKATARTLFDELLSPVPEYKGRSNVIVVPDGSLHLLPFSALMNNGEYVIANYNFSTVASGTVLTILRGRQMESPAHHFSYVGVAAWTKAPHAKNRVLQAILNLKIPVLRDIAGPERSELRPLPESQREVERGCPLIRRK